MTSKENKQGLFDSLGRASVMGLHMVSGIIVGCLLGYWLDKWFGTYPWCAGVGLIVGIGAGSAISGWTRAYCSAKGNRTMRQKATEITARSIGWRRGCGGAACRTPRSGNPVLQISVIALSLLSARCSGPFTRRGRGSSGLASERCSPHGIFLP